MTTAITIAILVLAIAVRDAGVRIAQSIAQNNTRTKDTL
jgi:hypothetical protein